MRDAVTISIPHTGTYFTIKLFTDAGYHDKGLFDHRTKPAPTIYHGHMLKEGQISRALELAQAMPLIIPFRHPYRVANSWNARGKPLDEMFACFRVFTERFLPLNPHLMPIDSPRRAEVLAQISRTIGVDLRTDGSVINGVRGTHKVKFEDLKPSKKVIELAKSLESVIEALY